MKKFVLLSVMAVLVAVPGLAWSQSAPSNIPPSEPAAGAPEMAPGAGMPEAAPAPIKGEKFEDHKARMLNHLNAKMAKMQEKIACVQAAANSAAIKACLPHKHHRH